MRWLLCVAGAPHNHPNTDTLLHIPDPTVPCPAAVVSLCQVPPSSSSFPWDLGLGTAAGIVTCPESIFLHPPASPIPIFLLWPPPQSHWYLMGSEKLWSLQDLEPLTVAGSQVMAIECHIRSRRVAADGLCHMVGTQGMMCCG